MSYSADKRKLLSSLCHGALFINYTFISIGVPIALLIISDDPVVIANAKESLNLHFNVWVLWGIFGVLWFLIITIPLALLVLIPCVLLSVIFPILAILKILGDPSTEYRYPWIIRLI